MADGVRITPTAETLKTVGIDTASDRPWVVRDISRPFNGPPWHECAQCGHHECKTYHFQLDADGTVVVSTTIWDRLQMLFDCGGFEKVNVVAEPPTQSMVLPTAHVKMTVLDM